MSAVLTFRADKELTEATDTAARILGLGRSDYVRKAVEEMNHRLMQERMVYLSQQLRAQTEQENQALDNTLTDGLHDQ